MNISDLADALAFLSLAIADLGILVYLRRRRYRLVCDERMLRSLRLHLRREISPTVVAPRPRWRLRVS